MTETICTYRAEKIRNHPMYPIIVLRYTGTKGTHSVHPEAFRDRVAAERYGRRMLGKVI